MITLAFTHVFPLKWNGLHPIAFHLNIYMNDLKLQKKKEFKIQINKYLRLYKLQHILAVFNQDCTYGPLTYKEPQFINYIYLYILIIYLRKGLKKQDLFFGGFV
jgi:hypothetical protein